MSESNNVKPRAVIGVDKLVDYLNEINVPISRSTIFRLLKEEKIPCFRISKRIVIFELNKIDRWIKGDSEER